MKILSIRLKNLASLAGEHFIDFESDPLASVGLIAIVGKTGAGKSTILDAMCLALFNKIPRLKDSDGKLSDVDGSEVLTNSPLTVLRRGTAHGFAELCFVAQDQKHYLARWEIKRARENANGKLQNVQRSLKCLTDGIVVADKTKAVETYIQQITQLSFEQFTRAVLLAQSEVTAFLKARDNERGELLEYLTNSSIFAKIGQLAFEKTRDISNQRKQLENILGHIELLSDDELTELRAQFETTQQQHQRLENEKIRLQQLQQWFERKQKLDYDILLKQQQYDEQVKNHQALEADQCLLNQLDTFSEIRPHVFQQQQLFKNQQQLEPQINQHQQLFSNLAIQFEQEKDRYHQAENALQQCQNFEQQHQTELNQVRNYIQERDYIAEEYKKTKNRVLLLETQQQPLLAQQQQLAQQLQKLTEQQQHVSLQLEQSSQFAPLDQGLNAHIQQFSNFVEQYQKVEHTIGDVAAAQNKLQLDQNTLKELIQTLGDSEKIELKIQQQQLLREQQFNRSNQLDLLQQKLNSLFELKQELHEIKSNVEQSNQRQQTLSDQTQNAEQSYQTTKSEREKLQQILQQQRLLHAENIEQLRAELKPGAPCVVCGSTEHPYRNEESPISKALYELQQQQEQPAIQVEQQHFKEWQALQQQLTQLQTQLTQLNSSLARCQEKSEVQQQELIQSMQQSGIQLDLSLSLSELTTQLHQHLEHSHKTKLEIEQEIQQLQQAQKQQLTLHQSNQNTSHQLQSIQQLQQQVQHIVECLDAQEQQQWSQHKLGMAHKMLNRLQRRAEQLEQNETVRKQQDLLQQQFNLLKADLLHSSKQQTELKQQLEALGHQGKQNSENAARLIEHMTGQTGLKANEWLAQHEQQRQHLQQHYHQTKQHFEQLRQNFEQQKNQLDQLKAQHQHNQNSLTQCQADIQQWLNKHSNFDQQQFATLLVISNEQEQRIRVNLQQAERQLNEANSVLKTIQEQLSDHLQLQPDIHFEQLKIQLQDIFSQLQINGEQRDQYKIKLELHQQNLARQQQYADQIQLIQQQEHRWNKISSLIGDAKGKDFRDLAQQYNLDILLEYANQQLAMLSQRYTLKRLENSLSLAIIDHDMDGEIRSVASLSGGESFLTALAISLAIANMASGSMKIESLFIDEGFGTLDASSLHMVMNALDQLQSQGRKVILISHIQEMHERIPVQIQVQPLGSGSSRIEVVG
ncbi:MULTISPECIES: AAA family ATPase [unclassified Acinetobacter]|uniref:AAA family ATPase n=1 Tax=unclassified Acinetobacter TaxID=196816 RepID=UPI00190AD431|nr:MULTISPECIES: AAA family ATPase [unclassified Acinetobacter]MBK0064965.1 AAA family ATPase [Acinetobacter sp. S55]MBK0067344.1 AAA family ATPase [Acinetobacter sp. S54]